jgi:hypothetical protein
LHDGRSVPKETTRDRASIVRRSVVILVAVAAIGVGARPAVAVAATTDRFVAWLTAHPEVQLVAVASDAGPQEPFTTRFPTRKTQIPPSAFVRIVDPRGSLICLTRPPARVCVRGPAAAHIWTDSRLSRESVRRREDVLWLGPLPGGRLATYSLRVPEAIARGGEPLRMNPKWVDPPHQGPWWVFDYDNPVVGEADAAFRKPVAVPPATDAPDWLDDAVGFSALTTGDPKVFRLQTATDVSLCVRGATGWVCRPLPPISLDEIHPGLPPTARALPPQPPVIYAARAAFQGDAVTVAIERSWIRSKAAHTPSLEWAGTFVEIVELRAGAAAFARRAALELTSGRLTSLENPRSGFPAVGALSPGAPPKQAGACIDVVAAGVIPAKMKTVPLGRYCIAPDGRLALTGTASAARP